MQISGSNILKTMSPPTESRSLAQAPVFQKQPLLKLFVFFATGKALEMLSFYFWITVRQRIAAPGHSLRPLDLWGIQYCPPLSPSLSCLFSGQFTPTVIHSVSKKSLYEFLLRIPRASSSFPLSRLCFDNKAPSTRHPRHLCRRDTSRSFLLGRRLSGAAVDRQPSQRHVRPLTIVWKAGVKANATYCDSCQTRSGPA